MCGALLAEASLFDFLELTTATTGTSMKMSYGLFDFNLHQSPARHKLVLRLGFEVTRENKVHTYMS